jgi:hypothetical protein
MTLRVFVAGLGVSVPAAIVRTSVSHLPVTAVLRSVRVDNGRKATAKHGRSPH